MRVIKNFEEFLEEGVVKKQSSNPSRAKFLKQEAKQNYEYLLTSVEKIKITDKNANNYVKQCYDIIMELIRSEMILLGYNSSGYSAHEAEVSYLRKIKFNETDIKIVDQLRYFRNGMLYYGKKLDKDYAEKIVKFTKELYLKFMKR
jgi:hypothetical protein